MTNDNSSKYKPQSKKNQTPIILALFTNKREKLPKDQRQLHREKFKQELKNNLQKTKR